MKSQNSKSSTREEKSQTGLHATSALLIQRYCQGLAICRLGEVEFRYVRGVGKLLTHNWHEFPRDVLIE
jgi:hypothetical protein